MLRKPEIYHQVADFDAHLEDVSKRWLGVQIEAGS